MRRLKKISSIISVIALIIGSCLIGLNVRGYDYQIDSFNYSPYTYIVRLDDLVDDGNDRIIALDVTYYASLLGNSVTFFISPYQDRIDYDEADYLATYNELIDTTTFVEGEYYFVNDQNSNYLANCSPYNVYYNYMIYSYYGSGYSVALETYNDATIQQAFNDGYDKGTQYTQSAVDDAIRQTNALNQDVINYLQSEVDRLNGLIDEDNPNWASFKNLLSTIFMFPIKFFKEGFGVEIWGVNIGYFIIGIFMIAITITLIALFRRGKTQ